MSKLLTPAEKDFLITEQAKKNLIEPAVLRAIVDVESSGSGFYPVGHLSAGKCKVRFEPDYFQKFSNSRPYFIPASVTVDAAKADPRFTGREAYEQAVIQSPASAIQATSFGLGQIMGFNFQRVGYVSLMDFSNAMEDNEYNQLQAFINFITADINLLSAAQNKDFVTVARLYNGKKYAERVYDKKLVEAYQKVSLVKIPA